PKPRPVRGLMMAVTAEPITFPAIGTTAVLLVVDPAVAEAARAVLEAELAAIDDACSRFREDSELFAVTRARSAPVRVSPLFFQAVGVALRAARLSDGSGVPAVGPAMRVLGYDR